MGQQVVSEQDNLKMSAIKFDIQKFDGVINFSRWQIKMNAILTQSGLKKALLMKEKRLENNILTVGATSNLLSKEVIGKSFDSEAMSLSSSHA